MEAVNVVFEDAAFDRLVHDGSLPQASTVTVAVKHKATMSGLPGTVFAFDVQLPDGSVRRAQATLTLKQMRFVLKLLVEKYGDLN